MEGFPVVVDVQVQWGEMDALGHVNNTRFFAWFESARIALFQQAGISTVGPGSQGPILATTSCDFLRQVVFPAALKVGVRVASLGNTSVKMEYQVVAEAGAVVARGTSVVVLMDFHAGTKVPLGPELRAKLSALTAAP